MALFLAHVRRIQPTRHVNSGCTKDDRPLELSESREHDSRRKRQQLEQVLEARFDRREGAARVLVDFLQARSQIRYIAARVGVQQYVFS